jgi:predicted regulator of Ras-like GTPase activity (Roadblock/LC7/MglB family)/predicted Zn-dependent protease
MIDSVEIDDRIVKCEKILEANPQSQIFAALADAYRKKGNLLKAQEICSQGLRLYPEYSSARIVMAKIYLAKGNYDLASQELERAITSNGRTRAIEMLEAEILIRRGQKAEACLILQGLEAVDPEDENLKNLKALLDEKPHPDSIRLPDEMLFKLDAVVQKNQSLSHALNMLKVMPRVLGALAVGRDGLLLDGRFDSHNAKEEFAALSRAMVDWAEQGSQKVNLGPVNEVLIETSSTKIWIFTREKYFLVVYTRDDASMGALKLKIEALFDDIDI